MQFNEKCQHIHTEVDLFVLLSIKDVHQMNMSTGCQPQTMFHYRQPLETFTLFIRWLFVFNLNQIKPLNWKRECVQVNELNSMRTKITCLISAGGEFEFIFEVFINLFVLHRELTDLYTVIGFFFLLSKSLSGPRIYDKKNSIVIQMKKSDE